MGISNTYADAQSITVRNYEEMFKGRSKVKVTREQFMVMSKRPCHNMNAQHKNVLASINNVQK